MSLHRNIMRRFRMEDSVSLPYIGVKGGREELVRMFGDLKYTRGVEVGTWRGHFAAQMCADIPNLKLTCVDPWNAPEGRSERHYLEAVGRLTDLGVEIMRMTSMEAVGKFEDKSLDYVYIDADHTFDYVMMDIIMWSKKVRSGGIVSGHDYLFSPDIARAVQTYVDCHGVHPWYVLREFYNRDRVGTGSFFWVVP